MEDIPLKFCIHDCRLPSQLKSCTLTGYKKTDVVNALQKSIENSKIEEACRWLVELHISGYIKNILSVLFLVYYKNININNPLYLYYFTRRVRYLNKLLKQHPKKILIFTRNNQEIRNLLCELVSILVYSKKNKLFENKNLPKIPKYAYDIHYIKQKIVSKNTNNILNYLEDSDLSEIKLALNEILTLLYSNKKTFAKITFWYMWLIKFMRLNKKKIELGIQRKCNIDIDEKYKQDWIWIFWKIIFDYMKNKSNNIKKYINTLYKSYILDYKGFNKTDKHCIIYYVIYMLTNNVNFNVNIRQQERYLIQASCNINIFYYKIEEELLSRYNQEDITNRFNTYTNLILKETDKMKRKKEKDIEKLMNMKNEKKHIKQMKRLNDYREFTSYKKKNVNDYFNEESQKKNINFVDKKIIKINKYNNNNNKNIVNKLM